MLAGHGGRAGSAQPTLLAHLQEWLASCAVGGVALLWQRARLAARGVKPRRLRAGLVAAKPTGPRGQLHLGEGLERGIKQLWKRQLLLPVAQLH